MKKLFCLLVVIACLCSCEFEYDVDINSDSRIYVNCLAVSDSVSLTSECALPATKKGSSADLEASLVELTIDGRPVTLVDGVYVGDVKEGSRIAVRVQYPGMKAVEGSTTMPPSPVVTAVNVTKNQLIEDFSYIQMDLDFGNEAKEGEYYAVTVFRKESERSFAVQAYAMDANGMRSKDSFTFRGQENEEACFFNKNAFTGKRVTLMMLDFFSGFDRDPSEEEDPVAYYAVVSRVSEELYRYSLARYKATSDILANLGLAPAQFAWTNINGGLGVCGAKSSIVTEPKVLGAE